MRDGSLDIWGAEHCGELCEDKPRVRRTWPGRTTCAAVFDKYRNFPSGHILSLPNLPVDIVGTHDWTGGRLKTVVESSGVVTKSFLSSRMFESLQTQEHQVRHPSSFRRHQSSSPSRPTVCQVKWHE